MSFFARALPLFLVLFLDGMGMGLVFPMLNSIIIDPDTSFLSPDMSVDMRNWIFGLVTGVYMLCWFFGAAVLGDLSDVIGRKKSLSICLMGAFVGYLFAALGVVYKSVIILIIGRMVAGFTSGSQSIAQAAIIDLSSEENKSRNIGFILFAVSLGFILGPMIGGLLSDQHLISWVTFATPFNFAAVVSILNLLFLWFFFKETHVQKKKFVFDPSFAIKIFISAFRSKRIRYLSVFFLIFILGWSSYYTYIAEFLFKKYQLPPIEVTFFMSLLGAGFALGFAFLPSFCAKRFSPKSTVVVSLLIGALCAFLTFLIKHPLMAWIAVVPMGAFISLAYSNAVAIFSNQVDRDSQGWIMGITGAIMALSFGVIGLSSALIEKSSANTPIIMSFTLLAISAIMLSFEKDGKLIHGPEA